MSVPNVRAADCPGTPTITGGFPGLPAAAARVLRRLRDDMPCVGSRTQH